MPGYHWRERKHHPTMQLTITPEQEARIEAELGITRLVRAEPTISPLCGEYRGYHLHSRNGEHTCPPCAQAKRAYKSAARARQRSQQSQAA